MIIGFKQRFVPYIESGAKTHTIRKGSRWCEGMKAHLYANPRTKQMRLLYGSVVTKVETIQINIFRTEFTVWIDNISLTGDEIDALAIRDGFPLGATEMQRWWLKVHGPGIFHGQIIHWRPRATLAP